jgi:Tol biopolymer transport system component
VPWVWTDERAVFTASVVGGDGTNLWDVGLRSASLELREPVRRLTMGTAIESHPSADTNGRLVFAARETTVDLWELPLDASGVRTSGAARRITRGLSSFGMPTVSDDGRQLSFVSERTDRREIFLKDLESGRETLLLETGRGLWYSIVSRDGQQVLYTALAAGDGPPRRVLFSARVSGGAPVRICEGCGEPTDWSRSGRILLQRDIHSIGLVDAAGTSAPRLFLQRDGWELYRAHFSPDEGAVAVHAGLPGRRTQTFVIPLRNGAPAPHSDWIAATDGVHWDDAPRWSPDGRLLYYVSDRDGFRCLWAQRLAPATFQPQGEPLAIEHFHSAQRGLGAVSVQLLDLAPSRGKLVFTLAEQRGNVWMAETP